MELASLPGSAQLLSLAVHVQGKPGSEAWMEQWDLTYIRTQLFTSLREFTYLSLQEGELIVLSIVHVLYLFAL